MLNPLPYYRLARWLYVHRVPLLPRIIQRLNVFVFHCYIPYTVEIGEGFGLGYWGLGVVIHPRTRIGCNVFVAQCVTIGGRGQREGVPRIENNVFIAAGAKVLGDIVVGEGSVIGANAVVVRSVPPRTIVGGVPARIIRNNVNVYDYTGWPPSYPPKSAPTSSRSNGLSAGYSSPRILHFIESLSLGGTETQMATVARLQSGGGYQVVVGCLSAQGPLLKVLEEANIPTVAFDPQGSLLSPRGLRQMVRFAWFLHRQRFDVVQTHELYSNLIGVPAAWLARVPVIVSSRRDLGHWWWYTVRNRRILRCIQNRSNVVIANSGAVRDYLINEDGFSPTCVRVVRNGVEVEPFLKAHADRNLLFPFLSREDKLVAVVANMNIQGKGHSDLIEAARAICSAFPYARFLLIGDGRERAGLEKVVTEHGLGNNILFLGHRNDVPDVLSCCDLSVLPSWAEGMPNAVLESMAAGLPVIATRVGGTPEIIEDGTSGLLVPPRSPQALADAILRVLRDPELARRLAVAGRERVLTCFSFDRVLRELRELYEEAWSRSGAHHRGKRSFAAAVLKSPRGSARLGFGEVSPDTETPAVR